MQTLPREALAERGAVQVHPAPAWSPPCGYERGEEEEVGREEGGERTTHPSWEAPPRVWDLFPLQEEQPVAEVRETS